MITLSKFDIFHGPRFDRALYVSYATDTFKWFPITISEALALPNFHEMKFHWKFALLVLTPPMVLQTPQAEDSKTSKWLTANPERPLSASPSYQKACTVGTSLPWHYTTSLGTRCWNAHLPQVTSFTSNVAPPERGTTNRRLLLLCSRPGHHVASVSRTLSTPNKA